ncbi:DUF6555 family protein [Pseudomonas huanghezhanensis]|uniref:DUF6555 family protein n=1 Tax=Pseudomonas huanghezhanensis TaxID=3002903 RepID=UPI002285F988|nr:DUF6555 family protein [Pseudomonas sp. BSw22131]
MAVQRFFQITYRLGEERKIFIQPDQTMTDADAWFYACLHARIGVQHDMLAAPDELGVMIQHAKRFELSEVRWEELP